jgi:hypothetical protein
MKGAPRDEPNNTVATDEDGLVGDLSRAVCLRATNLTTGQRLWPRREADAEDIALAEQKRDTEQGIAGYLCMSVLERAAGYGTSGGAVLKWVRGEIPPGSELRNGIVIQLFAQHGFFSPQQAKLGGASVYTTSPDGSTTTLVTEVNNENKCVSSFPDAEYMGVVYQWVRHVPATVYGGGKDELASIWSGGGGRYLPVTSEQFF